MSVEQRLKEMQITLPEPPPPGGVYAPVLITGPYAYVSGHAPINADGSFVTGKVGTDLTLEEGYEAAKLTAILMLATLKAKLGNLDRIKRVVKVLGLVKCDEDFGKHPAVINGFSEFMIEVFGDEYGRAARSALGSNSLPMGFCVEIEAIFELHPE